MDSTLDARKAPRVWQLCAAFSFVQNGRGGKFTTTKCSHAFDLKGGTVHTACGLEIYAGSDCKEWATSKPTCKVCAKKLGLMGRQQ